MSFFDAFLKKKKDEEREKLYIEVQEAWQRWQNSMEYFNSVTDPELVECAIHNVEATRLHYMYLINKLKKRERSAADEQLEKIM